MYPHPTTPSALQKFFAGVAEYTFQTQFGVADPPLIDYLSDLLSRFVYHNEVYRLRNLVGRRIGDVAGMLVEADERLGEAKRDVHRHIGDFTLFWTGVYPEALRDKRDRPELDRFTDYCQHGKRAYFVASTLDADESAIPPADVLERLSQHFELCAYGLREVRREWERRDGDEPSKPFLIN